MDRGTYISEDRSLTTVGVWKRTRRMLSEYAKSQCPRPIIVDLASLAIEEYIDRNPLKGSMVQGDPGGTV